MTLAHLFHGPLDPAPGEIHTQLPTASANFNLHPNTHIAPQFRACVSRPFTPFSALFETPLLTLSKWRHYADHPRRLYAGR